MKSTEALIRKISFTVLCSVLLLLCFYGVADSDGYYLIANGNYIINSGIPYKNPFVISDVDIVIQNWLYCVIVAFIDNHFHALGLLIFNVICAGCMSGIILKFFNYKHSEQKNVLILFAALSLACFSYINIRPEMLTFILIMSEILILESYQKNHNIKLLYLLPFLTLLEINLHASYWIMHYIVMLPYVVPFFKTENKTISIKTLIGPSALMTVSLFINPYGIKSITYIFNALISGGVKKLGILEQQSFSIDSVYAIYFIITLLLFIYLLQKKKINSNDFYMVTGFAVLFITGMKWVAFFTISILFVLRRLSEYIQFNQKIKKPKELKIVLIITSGLLGMIIGLIGINIPQMATSQYLNENATSNAAELNEVVNYLDKYDKNATVFSEFSDSNYFEYRGYKVYSDARPEIYEKNIAGTNEVFDTFYSVYYQKDSNDNWLSYNQYSEKVKSIKSDYFAIPKKAAPLYYYLSSNNYKTVLETENYVLFKNPA